MQTPIGPYRGGRIVEHYANPVRDASIVEQQDAVRTPLEVAVL